MALRKLAQHLLARLGQPHMHLAAIGLCALPLSEALRNQPVNQLYGAVMPKLKPFREVANACFTVSSAGLDSEHQLVLLRFDAGRPRGLLAESQEAPDRVSKF